MSDAPRQQRTVAQGTDGELNLRAIVIFVVGLVAIILASAGAMWIMSGHLREREARQDPPRPALPEARRAPEPVGPKLQIDPEAELAAMRAEEDQILHGFEWVDEANGVARIPVDLAIEALAARGSLALTEEPAND